ncbi:histidine kinase [Methylobacterium sp. Leaf89]|uniref:histidine kinase n=1 Tax=Methylobacterium sp. Leaf89 TaxID=1736245 RepID=UPI000A8AC80B|nr:histidine kinase [Methylobacterium sp. Leaf89]
MTGTDQASRRVVLVAEPQALPAMWLEDTLTDEGYAVEGPYSTCEEAVDGLARSEPAFALVSVDLQEGPCFPLACALRRRGIPFALFAGSIPVPKAFGDVLVLDRPCLTEAVARAIRLQRLAEGARAEPRECPMEGGIRSGQALEVDQCPAACGSQDTAPGHRHEDGCRSLPEGDLS